MQSAVRRGALTLLAGGALALLVPGCGEKSETIPHLTPEQVLQGQAIETFDTPATRLSLDAPGTNGEEFRFTGRLDLKSGGFRIHRANASTKRRSQQLVAETAGSPVYDVIGASSTPLDVGSGRCWFSNPYPAQAKGGMSMEDAARLADDVIESLQEEVAHVSQASSGSFEVRLPRSATHPQPPPPRDGRHRPAAPRSLLGQIDGPITVTVDRGRIAGFALEVDGYAADYTGGLYVPARGANKQLDDVPLEVSLAPERRPLKIHDPGCRAMT